MTLRARIRLQRSVSVLLAISIAIGPFRWQPTALASTGETAGADNCGDTPSTAYSCPPRSEEQVAPGSEATSLTDAPVDFSIHGVFESEVDLHAPGAELDWYHKRTYSSRMARNFHPRPHREGARWHGTFSGPYLVAKKEEEENGIQVEVGIELYVNANAKRLFSKQANGTYSGPADSTLNLSVVGTGGAQEIEVANSTSNELLRFYGLHPSVPEYKRGRLIERKRLGSPLAGNRYFYVNPSGTVGLVDSCLTSSNQLVDYEYSSSTSRLESISVYAGPSTTDTLLQAVEYTYFENVTGTNVPTDLGNTGDLVQVKVYKRASHDVSSSPQVPQDLSNVRCTQYRYTRSLGQLKIVLDAPAIQRSLDFDPSDDYSEPEHLLNLDDDELIGYGTEGVKLKEFASRSFEHDEVFHGNSSNIDSPSHWSEDNNTYEDLHKYGTYHGSFTDTGGSTVNREGLAALNMYWQGGDPYWGGAIKVERISGGCSSCGSTATPGVERRYYYLETRDWYNGVGSDDPNLVVRIVVEDTLDSAGTPQFRKIYGVNYGGTAIRTALLTEPLSPSASSIWCWSVTMNSDWRVVQRRMPSAHKGCVTSDAELAEFLNPTGGAAATSSNDTVAENEGVVYHFEYDSSPEHRPTGKLVSKGAGSSTQAPVKRYVGANDYASTAGNLVSKTYQFPDAAQASVRSNGISRTSAYTYWGSASDRRVKTKVTTLPAVSNNGSGVSTVVAEFYDQLGRLRWTLDGEGYVDYYSYHPVSGKLAFYAKDVNPASAPPGATGNDAKWLSWNDDGTGSTAYPSDAKPRRRNVVGYPTPPAALELVSTYEYDALGRPVLETGPGGEQHATVYYSNGVARFPYAVGGSAALPIQVRLFNAGGVTLEQFAAPPSSFTTSTTHSTQVAAVPSVSTYVQRTKYSYDSTGGQLKHVDRFHDVAGSTLSTHFDRTQFYYDLLGRRAATAQTVSGTSASAVTAQVAFTEFDALDRPVGTKRWRATSFDLEASYSSVSSMAASTKPATASVYDGGGVGDGLVTQTRRYFGTGDDDYYGRNLYYDWRGRQRGLEQICGDNGSPKEFGPYHLQDVDWLGRTTDAAVYADGASISWPTIVAADDYVAATPGDRFNWTKHSYDDLGRRYQTLRYPAAQTVNHQVTNYYYDRNGRLVATGDPHGASMEYAYDGAGRQYQQRTVLQLNSSKYDSSNDNVYNYRAPKPTPTLASSGGDEWVVELSHTVFDDVGNVTEQHTFELNHSETYHGVSQIDIGLNLSGSDCIRSTRHLWYDDQGRLTATADFGAGDGTSSSDNDWEWNAAPSYGSEPSASDDYKLVTLYSYNNESGRLETVTDPAGADTTTVYDDLGRRDTVTEDDGGTEERDTSWTYNGLGGVVTLTAENSTTGDQVTKYWYEDDYNAALVTHTAYPDSASTPSSGTDLVEVEYNMDGSVAARTDQRQVKLTYTYDDARRVTLEAATAVSGDLDSLGVGDDVQAIGRSYDSYGRLTNVTSWDGPSAGSSSVVNEVEYQYGSVGELWLAYLEHDGAVSTSTSPKNEYVHDKGVSGSESEYNDGLRYYQTRPVFFGNLGRTSEYYGNNGEYHDRMHLPVYRKMLDGGLAASDWQHTLYNQYNGSGRLARHYSPSYDVNTELRYYSSSGHYDRLDRYGRVKQQKWTRGGAEIDRFDYTYDYAGSRLSRDIPSTLYSGNDRDQLYVYDGLHRLKTAEEGAFDDQGNTDLSDDVIISKQFEQAWTLDPHGNWSAFKQDGTHDHSVAADNDFTDTADLDQDRVHNKVNEIAGAPDPISQASGQSAWATPAYDNAGNMSTIPVPESLGSSFTAMYDAWNRLVSLADGGPPFTYEYDGLHRRIQKKINSTTTNYYYNERWQCILESTGTGGGETPSTMYMWHPHYVDALAVRMRAAEDDEHYFTHDANFNVTAAVKEQTANQNAGIPADPVVERYAYTPYGECTVLDGAWDADSGATEWGVDANNSSDIDNEHLYTGRRTDPETGVQLNRYRFYHQQLGRWVSRDPIGYDGGAYNLYEYVGGMPTKYLDPSGLRKEAGPCTMHIYIGHASIGIHKEADEWREKVFPIVYPGPGESLADPDFDPMPNRCYTYAGAVSCFSKVGPWKQPIPGDSQIPTDPPWRFPEFGFRLPANKALPSARRAIEAAKELGEHLCKNRENLPDDYGPEYEKCGTSNMTCNSVTIIVTCDSDAKRLFEEGHGPRDMWGRPGRPNVIRPTDFSKSICNTRLTIDCLAPRRDREYRDASSPD